MRLRADLVLLLVAILWGSAFAAQRVAGRLGSVYFFNGARFLAAALIPLPFSFRAKWRPRQWLWMAIAGTILFVASALQQVGLLTTSAANAGFLTSLYVVLVPLVLLVAWKQAPQPVVALAVVIAAVGAFLLSTAGHLTIQAGDAWELGATALWALHVVILGKFATAYESISFSAGQLCFATMLNMLVSAVTESRQASLSLPLVGAILYTSVASRALGYTLQIWAPKHTPPTDAAIILSLESVFAVAAWHLVLAEQLVPIQLLGCGLILSGVIISQVRASSRMNDAGPSRRPEWAMQVVQVTVSLVLRDHHGNRVVTMTPCIWSGNKA